MPYGRDEWLERIRQRRAELIRLIYRQRIRRSKLKGGSEHDRSRNITPEQLEHAHDSSAYDSVIPPPAPRPADTQGNGGRLSQPDKEWLPSYIPESGSSGKQSAGRASRTNSGEQSKPGKPDVAEDSPAERIPDIDMFAFLPLDPGETLEGSDDWHGSTPLTPGQEMRVEHLLAVETDTMARDVLIGLLREGMPSKAYVADFMGQFAEWTWDDLSSALAMRVIEDVRNSDWNELLEHSDSAPAEADNRQPFIPTIGVKVSGILRVYSDEAFDPNVDAPVYVHSNDYTSAPLSVFRYSELNTLRVLVQIGDLQYWIDTTDEDAQFTFVALVEHGDASEQEAEGVVADGNQSGDEILPIIPDENAHGGSLNIEGEVARWDLLEEFVNTDLAELQRRAVENPEIIRESMALLEHIFGYNVDFWNPDFYIEEGKNEQKRLAIAQVFNIASSHYHVTNTFGIEAMRKNATATNYYLGADTKIPGDQPQFRGYVPLPQSSSGGLENAYIGSEMTIGGITHETFHEIDRRFGGKLSVHYHYDAEAKTFMGEGGLEWFLNKKVINRYGGKPLGFNFGMILREESAYVHLNENSRASDEEVNQEIFPDVAAAIVLGLHEEPFFSRAYEDDEENRIGFAKYNSFVKDLICGFHQYFEQVARGVRHPDDFNYSPDECIQ